MAGTKKGGGSKIWAIVFAVALLEFFYIIFKTPPPQASPLRVEGTIQKLIEDLYTSIHVSSPKKVLVYLVDADDNSGVIKNKRANEEATLVLSVPQTSDPNLLENVKQSLKITSVKFIPTKGKEAQDVPPNDDLIRQRVDNSPDVSNDIFAINPEGLKQKDELVEVPIQLNFNRTGYYRLDYTFSVNRLVFENNILRIGNMKIDLSSSKENIDKDQILKKWNSLGGSMYFCVFDATKPTEKGIPPKQVEIHTK